MLYLDYCATTPPYDEVVQTMANVLLEQYGNPSSLHRFGLQAERLVGKAREVMASVLGCKPAELVFSSGGTESNNLAIKGAAIRYQERGRHIIVSRIEHASVYEPVRRLEREGWKVTYLDADRTGAVDPEEVRSAIRSDTVLVSLMHVNNETGRIQPIEQVGRLLRSYPKIVFHVDAVQSIGKLPLTPIGLGADLMSGSAHKFRGPKGAGFLYVRGGIELAPLLDGGGQERGLRSGTENVPAIVGMAKAMRINAESGNEGMKRIQGLRRHLIERLRTIPRVRLTGTGEEAGMAQHLVHFTLPGLRAEVVVHALEEQGICISTRSACSSGEVSSSRVLLAMGYDEREASSGLRVSFSADQTIDDMESFVRALQDVMKVLLPEREAAGKERRST